MHCAFQAGFMSEAMWLVFKNIAILKFGSIGAGGDSMIGYLRQCQFPQCRRSVGRGLHHLFAPEMLDPVAAGGAAGDPAAAGGAVGDPVAAGGAAGGPAAAAAGCVETVEV